MHYFRVDIPGNEVHLYPLPCWHVGAMQSSEKFIRHVLETIKADPFAKAIYFGDGGECVTKNSKGNIYEQILSPGNQLRVVAEYLGEIKEKLLFGIRGNHGNRIDKETGVGWDEMLCARVGIPYLGVSAFGDIIFHRAGRVTKTISVYTHHGNSGSISSGGKVTAGRKPAQLVIADIALTAHTHACGEAGDPLILAETDERTGQIQWRVMRMYVCGSAYDSRSGYAEEKQYAVMIPRHIVVEARVVRSRSGKRDESSVEISHRIIDGARFINEHEEAKWRAA